MAVLKPSSDNQRASTVSPKDAKAAADLAEWLRHYDMGEVVVYATWGKERFRASWDKDAGLRVIFPADEVGGDG